MKLWMNTVHADKKVSITYAVKFYEDYKMILIFVLETGLWLSWSTIMVPMMRSIALYSPEFYFCNYQMFRNTFLFYFDV